MLRTSRKLSLLQTPLSAKSIAGALLLGVIALFITTGLIGVNFGEHWDEYIQYNIVQCSLNSGIFLPCAETPDLVADYGKAYYNYPSFIYLISLIAYSLGYGIKHVILHSPTDLSLDNFRMVARPLFLVISGLSGLWLYLSLVDRNRWIAVVAASIQLLSWEFAYHSRWIAPDAIMAQFFALWLMALAKAQDADRNRSRLNWITLAIISAALAAATKYTAVLLLPITILFAYLTESQALRLAKPFFKYIAKLLALFFGIFIVITPGATLQPLEFIGDLTYELHHYASGHNKHYGVAVYDVTGGFWTFAGRLWEYLGLAITSYLPILSLALILTAGLGLAYLFKTDRKSLAITIVVTFSVYFFLFSGRTVVFMVRNYLMFLPLLAFLIANGIESLYRYSAASRWVAVLLVCVALSLNAANLVNSALSINPGYSEEKLTHLLVEHIRSHPNQRFSLSKSLYSAIQKEHLSNVVGANSADVFVYRHADLRQDETVRLTDYPSTHHNTFKWLGPREVNYNYYVSWCGKDRILFLPQRNASRMGLIKVLANTY